jgi:transposase
MRLERKKKAGDQALGRSRGGFSTKLNVAVDALGNPVELKLTPGQAHDVRMADALVEGHEPENLIADKGFDSQAFVNHLKEQGIKVVIPPRSNRTTPRDYDAFLYKERNLVERFINRIKHYRRVATRYEKLARNFLGFVQVAAIMVLLR